LGQLILQKTFVPIITGCFPERSKRDKIFLRTEPSPKETFRKISGENPKMRKEVETMEVFTAFLIGATAELGFVALGLVVFVLGQPPPLAVTGQRAQSTRKWGQLPV
jgi:hypothetical protein